MSNTLKNQRGTVQSLQPSKVVVITASVADQNFVEPVYISARAAGDIKFDLKDDPSTATGTILTLTLGEYLPAPVRKIYQSGTTIADTDIFAMS